MIRRFEITSLPSTAAKRSPASQQTNVASRKVGDSEAGRFANIKWIVAGAIGAGLVLGWIVKRR